MTIVAVMAVKPTDPSFFVFCPLHNTYKVAGRLVPSRWVRRVQIKGQGRKKRESASPWPILWKNSYNEQYKYAIVC